VLESNSTENSSRPHKATGVELELPTGDKRVSILFLRAFLVFYVFFPFREAKMHLFLLRFIFIFIDLPSVTGEVIIVKANKEVILSAGAINSPQVISCHQQHCIVVITCIEITHFDCICIHL
jgi:hypothetical protein